MPTIRQSIDQASQLIDRFEAKLLLAHCLGVGRTYLITHDRDAISPSVWRNYQHCVEQRAAGIPIPYIRGQQEFFGRPFKVSPDVLIPRPDTETLIEFVLNCYPKNKSFTLLDMGTGSGCIAITLALENPLFKVSASDLSANALAIAAQNAKLLNADVDFYLGDWFQAIPKDLSFDIIVSNPPYIRHDDEHLKNLTFEPIGALTDNFDGLQNLEHLILHAPTFLNERGRLVLEHGWDQGLSVQKLFEKQGCWESIQTLKDLGGNDRITSASLK